MSYCLISRKKCLIAPPHVWLRIFLLFFITMFFLDVGLFQAKTLCQKSKKNLIHHLADIEQKIFNFFSKYIYFSLWWKIVHFKQNATKTLMQCEMARKVNILLNFIIKSEVFQSFVFRNNGLFV